jgi:SpoVK/Ycf46/Vps4 family AAA+-type ATPase
MQFPAKLVTTSLAWEDLVLPRQTLNEIQEVHNWITHGSYLLKDMELGRHVKQGYRSLFYGPPGTGKTLTASLLGKSAGLDVYRIDLSLIVSKFIGETEKNLSGLFDMAENKNWILFFDEADSLFGKRTGTKDSNDRYANQEVSYLLQRIEDFPGVVILASNIKGNIDDAFIRRFQSVIYFPNPGVEEKIRLWETIFRNKFTLEDKVDFEELSNNYSLTGGTLINVLRHCALKASARGEDIITLHDIREGVNKELRKEGKGISNA